MEKKFDKKRSPLKLVNDNFIREKIRKPKKVAFGDVTIIPDMKDPIRVNFK